MAVKDIQARAPRQTRDRPATERRLIDAVGAVIARDGLDGLGSRTVARQAGVDHMLINRYFGSLSGLLEAYAESTQHWPSIDEFTDGGAIADLPMPKRAARILVNLAKALRDRPILHQLLAYEGKHPNELTAKMASRRHEMAIELAERFLPELGRGPNGIDGRAMLSLIAAGIHYLAIRASQPDNSFNSLGINDPDDMARLTQLIEGICETCLVEA